MCFSCKRLQWLKLRRSFGCIKQAGCRNHVPAKAGTQGFRSIRIYLIERERMEIDQRRVIARITPTKFRHHQKMFIHKVIPAKAGIQKVGAKKNGTNLENWRLGLKRCAIIGGVSGFRVKARNDRKEILNDRKK